MIRNVQPGEREVRFEATITPGARCFLEVNAGEVEGIEIGDNVNIQGYTQPAQLDINSLMNFVVMLVVVVMMFKMVDRALAPPKEELRFLPQVRRELTAKWFEKGVEAGKTDGWMDVENTIKETAEKQPEIKDTTELVWTDIDSWEETDHFSITYGSKMWEDAKGDIDVHSDLKSEFWEGYLTGRRDIGYDIYDIAGKLVKGESLPQTKAKGGGKPTREDVSVESWVERDRLGI